MASVGGLKPVSRSQNQMMPESVCFDEFIKQKAKQEFRLICKVKTLTDKQSGIGRANPRRFKLKSARLEAGLAFVSGGIVLEHSPSEQTK